MSGQISEEVKVERLARLQTLLDEQQAAFNAAQVGQTLPVLFEKTGRQPGQIGGRTPYLQAVHCQGNERLIGQIVETRIVGSARGSLAGELAAA